VERSALAGAGGVDANRGAGRAVDIQVTRLRRKIEIDPANPRYLKTVRGRGYMLVPD
jgi:two-component system phosphate regulon response regulator OmpR